MFINSFYRIFCICQLQKKWLLDSAAKPVLVAEELVDGAGRVFESVFSAEC